MSAERLLESYLGEGRCDRSPLAASAPHAALCQPLDAMRPEKHCIRAKSDASHFHTFCNQVTKSAHIETYTCKSRELRHACQMCVLRNSPLRAITPTWIGHQAW